MYGNPRAIPGETPSIGAGRPLWPNPASDRYLLRSLSFLLARTPGTNMIAVRELTKLYGSFKAVDSISFDVGPGEVLGLVGPNGAGKTTTLRCLAGIMRPSRGTVSIGRHDIQSDPVAAKRELAFIPDEPHLFDYLTVQEHLRFIARLYGVADAEQRIPELLAELELTDKLETLPGALSRGMKQKLAIACGLLHNPSVLILDEPLTGLDPAGIRKMRQTIADRARAGTAVVLSSHLLNLVEELCTKLFILRRGQCVEYGTFDEILARRPELAGRSLEDVFLTLTADDDTPRSPDRA
jgi:ABC-2 type transport system ATP-binding protein